MDQHNSVEIVDKNGWRKVYPLLKNLIHVGSDAQNDIVLESWRGAGVAPRQLQLIAAPSGQGYRLVNLGGAHILLGETGVLAPRSAVEITDGDSIQVGDFRLTFCCGGVVAGGVGEARPTSGPRTVGAESGSKSIGLELFLPQTQLAPDAPIEGAVIVRNLGDRPAVQFKLALEGLPPECCEMGAGPLLFPNAEKEVLLRLLHPRGPGLLAGEHRLSVRARAPEAYPGESATVTQVIRVLPFFKHQLRLVTTE